MATVDESAATDSVAIVAARLRAGELQVDEALELLIDDAISRELLRAQRPEALRPRLRELLQAETLCDPRIADRIDRLLRLM